jgi:hypothetical protein
VSSTISLGHPLEKILGEYSILEELFGDSGTLMVKDWLNLIAGTKSGKESKKNSSNRDSTADNMAGALSHLKKKTPKQAPAFFLFFSI